MTVAANDERVTGAQSLSHWARETPHGIAVTEGGERYSYADMAALVVRMARHLSRPGLPPGSIAGIECSNRYVHLVMILACECLGLTTTSLVAGDLTDDSELLSHCAVLYTQEPCARPQSVPLTRDMIRSIARTPIAADDFRMLDFRPAPDSGGRIVKTSGTTGKQKCMRNSSIGIIRAVEVTQRIVDLMDASLNFVCFYPFTFRPSYTDSILALRSGRTIVFAGMAELQQELASIRDCHTVLLPSDAAMLADIFPGPLDTGIRCGVQINGGSLSPALRQRLLATFASTICNTYSMNETNYVALVDEHGVGTLLPGVEVRIAGDDGQDRAPGEAGVIMIRSSRMVPGYLWDEARTARHFIDGWHVTGDLGFKPAGDRLVVVGRADDMLNIGGVKVPPGPIEAKIKLLGGVTDAVLLGIESEPGLAELHLVIERSDPTLDAGLEHQAKLAIHRYGRGFAAHFLEHLPRTETGKVRRAALRALIKPHAD